MKTPTRSTPKAPWTYTVQWANPYREPPGPAQLGEMTVPAGTPCPPELAALHVPGSGYAIHINIPTRETRGWSPEAKARNRTRRLQQRLERDAPLFAEELTERELTARSTYYAGHNAGSNPETDK